MFLRYCLILLVGTFCSLTHAKSASAKKTSSKSPQLIVEREGDNIISYTNKDDVLCFISRNPGGTKFPGYDGLKNENKVMRLLSRQDYIEVLKYVWSENNLEKRVTWLKKAADEGHIICMFELCKEYALLGNVAESYFWLKLGIFRTAQDVSCCTDRSLADCPDFLGLCYSPFWENAVRKDPTLFGKEMVLQENFVQMQLKVVVKVLECLKNGKKLPSPAWLHAHGMQAFMPYLNDSAILHPENTFSPKRKEIVDQLEVALKALRDKVKPKTPNSGTKK